MMIAMLILASVLVLVGCQQKETQTQENVQAVVQTAVENPNTAGGSESIMISDFKFVPSELRIKKGTIVTWVNRDNSTHTLASDSGAEIDSQPLSQSQRYEHTFDNAGTYDYHCKNHPSMIGKIIVE